MYKAELKTKYKDLVRAGKSNEAQKVLNRLRKFDSSSNMEEYFHKTRNEGLKDKVWTKKELEGHTFDELREIGYTVGARGRSKKGLIKDILDIQSGSKEPEIE